ncbi:NmrA family protein [Oleiphilus messinensis]|uniref:NmrA family protein n=1 Tax=Oleiphilus messinensis TaxID=141451 RepID=A0A1Y0ICQ5_9GAMM|nr:NAD(P)H-binding protein [Oleiphilus messinensis]ARU57919.1 NmrA family protein [Oleiphilus messinensis]
MNVISVIGGTGNLGLPVAKQFLTDGFKVRIITRDKQSARSRLGDEFDFREADLMDIDSLRGALKGSHGVYINASGYSKNSYYENHVLGTRNILEALEGEQVECIGMISTASAYPEFSDRWDNKYKLEAEQLLRASGLPYLVFMPSWFMETLPRFRQKNKLIHIGPSNRPIHWLNAADYALIVSRAFQNSECRNRRLPIYGPEGISMRQAMLRFADHHQLKVKRLPSWLATFLGRLSRDEELVDVADLMQHYDRTGEKFVPDVTRTTTTFDNWLRTSSLG